jgi:hypothetical protein
MSVNNDEGIRQEYEGGRMRRPRAKKPTKQALLRKRLMKHFGGFFSDMQEAPPMPPPSMSPPSMSPPSPQDGGRRPRRRANSPVRRAKSPVRKAPVRRSPVRRRRLGGEGSFIQDMMNFSNNQILDPIGANRVLDIAANTPQQSYNLGVNTVSNLFSSSGGRKRRPMSRAASPKRRPVRRAASPKRRPVRRVMRSM